MYRQIINPETFKLSKNIRRISDMAIIPADLSNTDYAAFKADILADKATLQDADGNEMTAEQAKQFVQELP